MSDKMIVNVLGMKRWSLKDEITGELRQGVTVYIGQETFDERGKQISADNDSLGLSVMKLSAPFFVFDRFKAAGLTCPSECEVLMTLKLGAGGKAVMSIQDFVFS